MQWLRGFASASGLPDGFRISIARYAWFPAAFMATLRLCAFSDASGRGQTDRCRGAIGSLVRERSVCSEPPQSLPPGLPLWPGLNRVSCFLPVGSGADFGSIIIHSLSSVTERYTVRACIGPPIRLIFVLGVILTTEGVMDFTLGLLSAVALIIMTAVVVTVWELFEKWEVEAQRRDDDPFS
jgi:hypothetical protein